MIELNRPLVFLDLEATGVWPEKDRIVEIAMIRLTPGGEEEVFETRVNPEMKIPKEVIAIHGITDEDVKDSPLFSQIAPKVVEWLTGADVGGFSLERFDLLMLGQEFSRTGIKFDFSPCFLVDAQRIFVLKERRNLESACRLYLGKPLENAHSAMADTRATLDVFKAQLERYSDLPREVKGIHLFTRQEETTFADKTRLFRWWNGELHFNFGKGDVYGRSLREVAQNNRGYLQWMMSRDFSPEVKKIVEDALNNKFPAPGIAETSQKNN